VDPLVETFAGEAAAAGAEVHGPVGVEDVLDLVRRLVLETGSAGVLAWEPDALGIPDAWRALEARGITPVNPILPADPRERLSALGALDGVTAGLTGTLGALADTGTIALASGPGRPRLAWLLPSRHIALVDTACISPNMDAFLHSPAAAAAHLTPGNAPTSLPAHLAFVTGPSRSADVELTLTRGVHGPREVHLILMSR
jgi:L-lactate dehydrogenase complex protein LldG